MKLVFSPNVSRLFSQETLKTNPPPTPPTVTSSFLVIKTETPLNPNPYPYRNLIGTPWFSYRPWVPVY